MRLWYTSLTLVLLALLTGGCRTNPRIAALQRDNRLKEDEIYRLRWQVEDCQEELQRRRQVKGSAMEPAAAEPSGQTILERLGAPAEAAPSDLPVQIGESISPNEFRESREVEKPLDGPVLPFPDPADEIPSPTWPAPDETEADDEAPRWSSPPKDGAPAQRRQSTHIPPVGEGAVVVEGTRESRHVEQLRIDASATGGHNLDGQPGDDGLQIVIELFDGDQRPIPAPAEISIVLLDPDPSLKGDAARVARWDFTADEVAAAIRASEGDYVRGIRLKVLWRDKAPQNEHLHLFVRYTTADGRRLEDQMELRIRLPGTSASSGWKTAPQDRPPPPPKEDRATTQPESPNEHTRFATRSHQSSSSQPEPASQPRLPRPRWSPNRP